MSRDLLLPKVDFLKDAPRASAHHELMANPAVREAIKIALLQYAMNLGGDNVDGQQLVTVGLKIEGAKGFISELLNLGHQTKPTYNESENQLEPV